MAKETKVLIVGGGVAGLSAGIFCQKAGLQCRIVEKQACLGGNLTGWDRNGCHIDNCIHWLTGTRTDTALNALWREVGALGEDVSLVRPRFFYCCRWQDTVVYLWRNTFRSEEEWISLSPEDEAEIRSFFRAVRSVAACSSGAHIPFAVKRYLGMTLEQLSGRFQEAALQAALTGYLGRETAAIALLYAYATFASGNGDIPLGGSSAMAERIAGRFRSLGGEADVGTEVARIERSRTRAVGVRLKDGRRISADYVVAATDPAITFGRLLPKELTPYAWRFAFHSEGFRRFSSIHAAFVCDRESLPAMGTELIDGTDGRLIVRVDRDQPSFAPDGKTVVQVMAMQSQEACRRWVRTARDPAAYQSAKEALGAQFRAALEDAYPTAKASLQLLDVWTPASYRHFTGAPCGAYLGFSLSPWRFLWRFPSRLRSLPNVFLATQWSRIPGGLPTALQAGKRAADRVISLAGRF